MRHHSNQPSSKFIIEPVDFNKYTEHGLLAVTKEVFDDAMQILDTSGGVIKSASGNKMNEIGPHRCWAEKIVMRAKAYGVIASEANYRDLFEV